VTTTFVDGTPPHVHAVVDMTSPVRGRLPRTVGKTIFTGWRRDQTPVTRLLVHLTAIEILNPLKPVAPAMDEKKRCSVTTAQDCSATPCPRGEKCLTLGGPIPGWELFFETNGDWRRRGRLVLGHHEPALPRRCRLPERRDVRGDRRIVPAALYDPPAVGRTSRRSP